MLRQQGRGSWRRSSLDVGMVTQISAPPLLKSTSNATGQRDVQFSSQNQVKTKNKGHHVFRRSIFLQKSSIQRPLGYAPESVRILKDFRRIPETAPSNTRQLRLRNTGIGAIG